MPSPSVFMVSTLLARESERAKRLEGARPRSWRWRRRGGGRGAVGLVARWWARREEMAGPRVSMGEGLGGW